MSKDGSVLRINPVILSEEDIDAVPVDEVPGCWDRVAYPDIVQAAKGFHLWARDRDEFTRTCVAGVLKALACGYGHDHFEERLKAMVICPEDAHYALKMRAITAVRLVRETFLDRLPWQFYVTLAVLATRSNPTEEVSILTIQDALPVPWTIADGLIHAATLPTPLWEQVQSIFVEVTQGYRFQHGCDCSCATPFLGDDGRIESFPYGRVPAERSEVQCEKLVGDTYSFAKHALGQILLLVRDGLPFAMGAGLRAKQLGHSAFMHRLGSHVIG